MLSKPVAVVLLAAACVAAAAGGAFLAVRENPAEAPAAVGAPTPTEPAAVAETEALVDPGEAVRPQPQLEREAVRPAKVETSKPAARPAPRRAPQSAMAAPPEVPAPAPEAAAWPSQPEPAAAPADVEPMAKLPEPEPAPTESPLPPARFFEDVVVPAASVIGLQIETPVSTERARLEDRVEARVLRAVLIDGRTAIPAGSRAIGAVTLVDQGGKLKERARLGVRFHTLVLADGMQLPVQTETILREGDSPSGESARKIGGAAAGGAILGAILGGKKGAVLGGATGAAGGTAIVFAGDRNPATLPAGAVVTVRLSEPLTVEVERR